MVGSPVRNWRGNSHGALEGPPTPIPDFFVPVALALLTQNGKAAYSGRSLMVRLVAEERVGSRAVQAAMNLLLPHAAFSPAKAATLLESHPELLPTCWPLLSESVRFAAEQTTLPTWLSRVLEVLSLHGDTLSAAAATGRLPLDPAAWPGLVSIAERPGSWRVLVTARVLLGRAQ